MKKDPVCGKEIDELHAPFAENYEGHDYFFCSEACRRKFNEHPDQYSDEGLTPGIQYPMGVTEPPAR